MKIRCIEKKAHETIEDAKDHVFRLYEHDGMLRYIYECPVCLDFHVTRSPQEGVISHVVLLRDVRITLVKKWFNRLSAEDLLARAYSKMNKHLKHRARYPQIKPLPFKIKPEILPLVKQREALAKLHAQT